MRQVYMTERNVGSCSTQRMMRRDKSGIPSLTGEREQGSSLSSRRDCAGKVFKDMRNVKDFEGGSINPEVKICER